MVVNTSVHLKVTFGCRAQQMWHITASLSLQYARIEQGCSLHEQLNKRVRLDLPSNSMIKTCIMFSL